MKKSVNYQSYLIKSLKDPVEAVAYLNAALEENDSELFLLAIRNVAEAWGGVKKLATKAKLNRENLYRILSKKGNPALHSLQSILEALGLKLAIALNHKKAA